VNDWFNNKKWSRNNIVGKTKSVVLKLIKAEEIRKIVFFFQADNLDNSHSVDVVVPFCT